MRRTCLTLLAAALWLGPPSPARTAEKSPTAEQLHFFETSIRPLLAEHCWKCHGPQKQRGDLRLDSRARILRGGPTGPAVVPGRPEESLLIKMVRGGGPYLEQMPPGKPLAARQVADLERWVRMGTPFPPDRTAAEAEHDPTHFWAFRPPAEPPLPAVKDGTWPRSPLDRFVLDKLEAKGLKPSPAADRRTLIRRATFDLTGLPPTPADVEAFLGDPAPDAFARVVDRLLASPHYGERWGRHWLDVVRYADSNGLDENVAFGTAWRYRDYVVAAFNRDLPYDQFLLEQLAGDLLPTSDPADRRQRLIATGFLGLGPKVLAEVDEKKMEMDVLDEQLDTVGRSLLGLTLGCARCHDHKFDPISTRDYYGLAGIFASTRTMESFKKVARWHENLLPSENEEEIRAAHARRLAEEKDGIDRLVKEASEKLLAEKGPKAVLPQNPEALYPEPVKARLKQLRDSVARLQKEGPDLPTALGVCEGKVVDVPVHLRGDHLKLGEVVARRVPQVLAGPQPPTFDTGHSGRLELARWLTRPDHPLTARVMVNRVWRWHFGQGLVRTPDNFGRLGEAPDNQPLLDWLARRFVAEGWSVKALHRLILLSGTYQMSAGNDPHAAEVDPENRLHWRANVRRLQAEAVRDALLAVSGNLDRTLGGSLLHVKNREYLFDHTSKDGTQYDSRRRSLYLPVVRNNVYDVFQLFDFPDPAVPTGDRATTTVAPQALFLMNSDWVGRLCDALAGQLLGAAADDGQRVGRLYAVAYGREATARETAAALALLGEVERELRASEPDAGRRRLRAWSSLCQVVVAANEFLYVP